MTSPRIGSLFSGSGMLDEGVRSVLGGTVAWHAEVEPAAVRVLEHRYPGVPNLGDVTTVDWSQVEPVDVLTGGSPCQDVSHAGARRGMRAGTRSGLWSAMVDAIDALRPQFVVWENVRGVLSAEADSALEPCAGCVGDGDDGAVLRALGRVLGDLAGVGYDARWCGLRAADVGAPHGRFRVFVVAWDASVCGGDRARPAFGRGQSSRAARGSDLAAADASRGPLSRAAAAGDGLLVVAGRARGAAPDTSRDGRDEGWPESARLVGGPDAAERGAGVASDADRDAVRVELVAEPWRCGSPVTEHARANAWGPGEYDCPGCGDSLGEHHYPGWTCPAANPHDDPAWTGCEPRDAPQRGAELAQRRDAAADADRDGLESIGWELPIECHADRRGGADVAWGQYEPAIRRWERVLGRPAPAPTETGPKGGQRLSPRFTEWMQGWPDGWVTDVPGVTRNEALKLCGNGVVPQQAAEAVQRLLNAETCEAVA